MKIITWNCNMAFRKKADFILKYKPDILVVPECEHPDKLVFAPGTPKPKDSLWVGENLNKGLGIFSYGNYRFSVHKSYNRDIKLIVPILVKGGALEFTLFAIWANNSSDKDGQYIEQVWKAIRQYDKLLTGKKNILIGDFNSNTIWDKQHRVCSHSNVVELLGKKKIVSAYHVCHKQGQGTEAHPTLYMYRHEDKPYHIDYCFVSADLAEGLKQVEVGGFNEWCSLSDHVPLMVTFKKYRLPGK